MSAFDGRLDAGDGRGQVAFLANGFDLALYGIFRHWTGI